MIKRGVDVKGFNTAFSGDVPLGAGMSSSAALESTYAFALNDLFGENKIDKFELAKIGRATEHNYCGVNCGIMDQFASVFGKEGSPDSFGLPLFGIPVLPVQTGRLSSGIAGFGR